MIRSISLLRGLVPSVLSTSSFLLAAPAPVVPDTVLAEARRSVLSVELPAQELQSSWCYGAVLVGDRGLAIAPLVALAHKVPPIFRDARRQQVPFRKVLAFDPELSLAVVQLDSGKRPGLALAPERPPPGAPITMLWDHASRKLQGVVDGEILAYRQLYRYGPASPEWMSLGVYPGNRQSSEQQGSPIINPAGELVGIFKEREGDLANGPQLTFAVTSADLAPLFAKAKQAPNGVPFPLRTGNPFDDAFWEYSLSPLSQRRAEVATSQLTDEAEREKARAEEIEHLERLVREYPGSDWAKQHLLSAIFEAAREEMQGYLAELENGLSPEMEFAVKQRFRQVSDTLDAAIKTHDITQGEFFIQAQRVKRQILLGSGEAEKVVTQCEKELEAWGDAPPCELLIELALAQGAAGHPGTGETYRRACEQGPDSMLALQLYEFHLNRNPDPAESLRVSERLWALEEAFAPRRRR